MAQVANFCTHSTLLLRAQRINTTSSALWALGLGASNAKPFQGLDGEGVYEKLEPVLP